MKKIEEFLKTVSKEERARTGSIKKKGRKPSSKKPRKSTLTQVKSFVSKKSKQVTDKPVNVTVSKKKLKGKSDVVARLYTYKRGEETVKYEIAFGKNYYDAYKNNPKELKNAASHELAHINHPKKHTPAFRKEARKLGADESHVKAVWD